MEEVKTGAGVDSAAVTAAVAQMKAQTGSAKAPVAANRRRRLPPPEMTPTGDEWPHRFAAVGDLLNLYKVDDWIL